MHNQNLFLAVGAVWAILILASIIVFTLTRISPQKDYTDLVQRTKSWWAMLGMFSLAIMLNKTVSIFFLGFISFLALKEFFSSIPTRRADRRILFWCYLAIPVQYYWASLQWYGMFIIFIPVYMLLFINLRVVLTQKVEGFLKSTATMQWGLMVCVFALSHMAFLVMLPDKHVDGRVITGAGLLLYLAFLTQANDVAQYVWGKSFGKRKILPLVSPKKTWEGFLGGVGTTIVIAAIIAPYLTQFNLLQALLAGAIIGVGGFFGDVTLSAVKRDIAIKDFGELIPGHGGILDRIDSLTFVAPLFFHYTWYLFY